MKTFLRGLAALAALLVAAAAVHATGDEFLDPEAAFKLSAEPLDAQRIELRFDIAPGYYLYRERIRIEAATPALELGAIDLPRGKIKFDQTFQKDVEYYRDRASVVVPLAQLPAGAARLVVGHQGCADKGLCYPPMERTLSVERAGGAGGALRVAFVNGDADAAPTTAAAAIAAPPQAAAPAAGAGSFAQALGSRSLLKIAGVFLVAGLLLSLTPCVLPMVPILSSIIVGQGEPVSKARGFTLAFAYALGMALVYTAFGMAAGLAGEGLAAALQNAWVLGAFALLLVALSLAMFGVYELQMPAGVQSRLTQWSGRMQGGRYAGVFVMGGMSALIVGPCVAAPLAGALVYISQTRDVLIGGAALFALACGMSVPLLLVGVSAGSLLPRAGAWMERVKHFFGAMLLAVALWLASPVLPPWAMMLAIAALLLAVAVYLGAFDRRSEAATPLRAATQGAGLLLAALAVTQLAGAASGGRDPLQPLAHLTAGAPGAARTVAPAADAPSFRRVASLQELDAAVRASTRPVMVDFVAEWCVSCKELENFTFSDGNVRQAMSGMTLLRVDVTANSDADKALMRRYSLFGPPAVLFFQPGGHEVADARVIGFENAEAFGKRLRRHFDAQVGAARGAADQRS